MKIKIFILALFISCAFALTACENDEKEPDVGDGVLDVPQQNPQNQEENIIMPKHNISAEQWNWKDVELNGMGWMTGVVVCPSPPYQIYARSDVGGVYRYNRETERWTQTLDSFGLDDRNVYSVEALAVDPSDGNILYFAGNATDAAGEIWTSADAGETWRPTGLRGRCIV